MGRQFAYKTVAEARDLKTLFAAVDETQDQAERQDLFRLAVEKMTGFMKDTLEKLRGANEKYKTAKKTFVDLKNFSTQSKDKVEKMLNTDSDEYKKWVKLVTEAVRNASDVPEQVRNITAEIEAEKEPATKIVIDEIEAKIKNDIKFAIKRYHAKLEKLKEVTANMLESGKSFEETIDNAMNILQMKIEKINISAETANVVSKNKEQFLEKYQDISNELIKGLDNLNNSAETFLSTEQ